MIYNDSNLVYSKITAFVLICITGVGTLRVYTSRLATKESCWIFHKDGDDFDLKVSDPKSPSYLLILNRLVTRVNTGLGKNVPEIIIVDELPALYFNKVDPLIGTARSNKVSVMPAFRSCRSLKPTTAK